MAEIVDTKIMFFPLHSKYFDVFLLKQCICTLVFPITMGKNKIGIYEANCIGDECTIKDITLGAESKQNCVYRLLTVFQWLIIFPQDANF